MKTKDTHARDGQAVVEKNYQSINRPYSAAVLGMGPDGPYSFMVSASRRAE